MALQGKGISMKVDVIVIGAGAMGTAAAWRLARRGRSVLVLERFDEGHDVGASHGTTRNFSTAYDDDMYLGLLARAREYWRELEAESGQQVIDWVGLVQHGWQRPLETMALAHARHGIRSQLLDGEEAQERWTGLRFDGPVLYSEDAGRIRAADAIQAMRGLAEAAGAQFLFQTPVTRLEWNDSRATVYCDGAEYRSDSVVLTAGAWTEKLLAGRVQHPRLRVTQEQPAHFALQKPDAHWPGFMQRPLPDSDRDSYWYSTTYGMLTPDEGIKVGWHGTGPETDPDRRTFTFDPPQMDALRRYVREWIPGADPDRFDAISCTYTTTSDEKFVVDRMGPICVGAGFSGHGFKFAPAIGEELAKLITGEGRDHELRLLTD